eukprot:Phypoly_transcript_30822.p1 GENE.Phypoly_transcript_30822~~Phypoly_transcript_30822.p1  ORF type:complete len:113 (+),score=22.10 Phypoly_transcript_30822:20-358(+)
MQVYIQHPDEICMSNQPLPGIHFFYSASVSISSTASVSISNSASVTTGVSTATATSSSTGTPGGKFLVPLWITAISSLIIILLLVIVIIVIVAGAAKAKGYMALSNGQIIEI